MTTFKRICLEDIELRDADGKTCELKRGREYITSAEQDGEVCVFTRYWVHVPVSLFAGAVKFT